jgi:hypothetical protein
VHKRVWIGSAPAPALIVLHVYLDVQREREGVGGWLVQPQTPVALVVLHVLDVLEGGLHLLLHLFILLLSRQQVV